MKFLVTGGAGFIGQHVVRELMVRGHEVRVLDSLRPDVHRDLNWRPPSGADFIHADVRDAKALEPALEGVDAVIHLAAKVGLGVDISDTPDYVSSNDFATAELLAAMARTKVGRLTLASSMVAYGEGVGRCEKHGETRPGPRLESAMAKGQFDPPCPTCGMPLADLLVTEDVPVDPRNVYATTKVAQEFLAGNWARSTGGAVASMRYHNVYGPGMPRDTPYAGVAAIFLSALRRNEAPRVFEDGRQRRDFIHVRDIAAATVLAAEGHVFGVRAFNVGSGTPRTVGEMAFALARALDGPTPVVTGAFRLGDVRHITADSSRLRAEFHWEPRTTFEDGMRELATGSTGSDPVIKEG
jgi:dTDP-L-rhamnose 4-epimerase